MGLLTILQIIVSVVIIILVLIQERSSGLSNVLGGGAGGAPYSTRRGTEKFIFRGTIVAAVLFIVLAVANLLT